LIDSLQNILYEKNNIYAKSLMFLPNSD